MEYSMFQFTLTGRVRKPAYGTNKDGAQSKQLTAGLSLSVYDTERNASIGVGYETIKASGEIAEQLLKLQNRVVRVSGFLVADGTVTVNNRGFFDTKYRALVVQELAVIESEAASEEDAVQTELEEVAEQAAPKRRRASKAKAAATAQ